MFYWMQEPKAEGDSDVMFKVNEAINNPGAAGSSSSRGGGGGTSGGAATTPSEQEMHNLLSSMSQSQLMQLIGGTIVTGSSSVQLI